MEEKERYELFGEHCIKDNDTNARRQLLNTYQICVILNEQDKENQQLKQQLEEKDKEIDVLKTVLGQASIEAFGKKESFVSSNYPKKIANANEYMEFLIYIASKEK